MYRVLIVDDEQIVRDGLERILNKIPNVTVAAKLKDGMQAKEYLEKKAVDAVFSDIRMAVMDGLELAGYLSVYKPECKIVLISAYNDFSYAQQAMTCGVKYYLMKPIRLPEVKRVIEQLTEERNRRERKSLWNHDLKREIQELELYHALISGANPAEEKLKKKLYYAEYEVRIESEEYETIDHNDDLLRAGWTNIFRWCSPLCIPVLTRQTEEKLYYILLAEEIEQFPAIEDLQERAENLMDAHTEIRQLRCADAKELIQNCPKNIVQDEITDAVIVKAQEFIARNLSQNISRTDVAEAVHLDPSYFSKYFKKKCGMNFHDYLQQERIQKVVSLLESGYKVQDAASKAGFQNRNYFNQVFKQYTGYSPSDYRKGRRKAEEL